MIKDNPPKYTMKNGMLCWNPGTDQVRIVEWPDESLQSYQYMMTGLACWQRVRKLTKIERVAKAYVEAMHLIIRDRCDPDAVHAAMCELEEYQSAFAEDMPDFRV